MGGIITTELDSTQTGASSQEESDNYEEECDEVLSESEGRIVLIQIKVI